MVCFMLVILAVGTIDEPTWSLAFNQTGYITGRPMEALELPNGNLVVSISSRSTAPELLCIEPTGEVRWHRSLLESYDSEISMECGGFLAPIEQGFAVCFYNEPLMRVNQNVAVVGLSPSGEILWSDILGLQSDSIWRATDLVPSSDGGLLITGRTDHNKFDCFLLKLSATGQREWMLPPGQFEAWPVTALEKHDGSFDVLLISGLAEGFLACVDSGKVLSVMDISSDVLPAWPDYFSVIREQYGRYYLLSARESKIIILENYDENINEIILPQGCYFSNMNLVENRIIVAGHTEDDRAFLGLYELNGETVWEHYYGGSGDAAFNYPLTTVWVLPLRMGFLYLGWTGFPDCSSQTRLIRLDSEGLLHDAIETGDGTIWKEPDCLEIYSGS